MKKNDFKPMSLKDGRMFIDGREAMSAINLNVVFTPQTSTYRLFGNRTDSTKMQGGIFSGTITQYKANKYWTQAIKDYLRTGIWPEIEVSGIADDPNADFVKENGSDRVTVRGIVPTGDVTLFAIDTTSNENAQETITFNADEWL